MADIQKQHEAPEKQEGAAQSNLATEAGSESVSSNKMTQAQRDKVLEPDVPPELLQKTPESARLYDLTLGGKIADNLRQDSKQTPPKEGNEPQKPLDKDINWLKEFELD